MAVLLFDYDGVIADTFNVEKKYFLPICKNKNIEAISTQEDLRGLCDGNVFNRLTEIGVPLPIYMEAFTEFHQVVSDNGYNIAPYPGIIELLSEVTSKVPVYVVTSNIYDFPNEMFLRHNVTGIKDILSGEKETSKVKKINSVKAMYPNDKVYFITDTTGDVIEARKSLADEILAVSWGWHDRKRLEAVNADMIFDNVGELRIYFKKLF